MARYDVNSETYHWQLLESKKNPEETYSQVATRILDFTNQRTKEYTTVEELRELNAVEQYLNILPADIQVWIRLAVDNWQVRNSVKSGRKLETSGWRMSGMQWKCFECGQLGHIAKDVPRGLQWKQGDGQIETFLRIILGHMEAMMSIVF